MTAYILDPTLAVQVGHHAQWVAEFVHLFQNQDIEVKIFGNAIFPADTLAGLPVIKYFTGTTWHSDDKEDLLKNWDTFFGFNGHIFRELRKISAPGAGSAHAVFTPDDIVIFPSLVEFHLTGIVKWFNTLGAENRPTVLCNLMGPSGCTFDAARETYSVYSVDTARFYKLAFRDAEKGPKGLHFFGCGEVHSEQYSFLRGQKVEPQPLLNTALQVNSAPRAEQAKEALLFVGQGRAAKGAGFVAQMVDMCCSMFPDWNFTVQMSFNNIEKANQQYLNKLRALAKKFKNFRLIFDHVTSEQYCDLFNQSEIVVMPYLREKYFNHSSGIVWESISTANTLIVPEDTWLDLEAKRQGAAYVSFKDATAESIVAAIKEAIENPAMERADKIEAAWNFKQKNTQEKLKEQVFAAWSATKSARA
ncbi:MAG: hypothetical protein COB37_04885 [Kordiimonadales bacterium]|nr:MAG: hypothetical protein COB37_04885 [Kordiimonadales bacterium]